MFTLWKKLCLVKRRTCKNEMSFKLKSFDKYKNVQYGFSEKSDGQMHRYFDKNNREVYFIRNGLVLGKIASTDIAHGSVAVRITKPPEKELIEADGLITGEIGLFLTATAADCFLLYLQDPLREAVGIVHAGWRGILTR